MPDIPIDDLKIRALLVVATFELRLFLNNCSIFQPHRLNNTLSWCKIIIDRLVDKKVLSSQEYDQLYPKADAKNFDLTLMNKLLKNLYIPISNEEKIDWQGKNEHLNVIIKIRNSSSHLPQHITEQEFKKINPVLQKAILGITTAGRIVEVQQEITEIMSWTVVDEETLKKVDALEEKYASKEDINQVRTELKVIKSNRNKALSEEDENKLKEEVGKAAESLPIEGACVEPKIQSENNLLTLITSLLMVIGGVAGSGKTMAAMYIVKQWAEGKLQQFEFAFYIPYDKTHANDGLQEAIKACIKGKDFPIPWENVWRYLCENQQRVLVVIDGYRENLTNPEKFHDIFKGYHPFNGATFIIFGRSDDAKALHKECRRNEYHDMFPWDQAMQKAHALQYFEDPTEVEAVVQQLSSFNDPVLTSPLCQKAVFQWIKKNKKYPTIFQIYEIFLNTLIQHEAYAENIECFTDAVDKLFRVLLSLLSPNENLPEIPNEELKKHMTSEVEQRATTLLLQKVTKGEFRPKTFWRPIYPDMLRCMLDSYENKVCEEAME